MSRVLIVDDESRIRDIIKTYLEFDGFEILEAEDGSVALEIVKREELDCVVMDVMMPVMDGYKALSEIRKIKETLPVIMLTAKGEEYDRLEGFERGADDYVVKPFSPKEIVARVKLLVRKYQAVKPQANKNSLQVEGIEIDEAARIIYVDGNRISTTPKEFDLLVYFMRNRNIALSREQLLDAVWGTGGESDDRTVDAHIKMLRKNIAPYSKYIVTVWGVGYKFEV
ncbi:MAG: response regulator transcription factor [Erysipelotrichaceae bacterium]|nr:response regulator transcription factor [Erysipelotrichaceae bacterium]MBR3693008.1 response regulator transcription factor [Erysipelotrichales bacterium]